jgi:FkbM family methyltransferase
MTAASIVASVTRIARFPGRFWLLGRLFPPQRYRQAGTKDRWLTKYDGDLRFLCNLGSFIEWNVYFRGYHDPDFSAALKRLTQPGMLIVDVGANVGGYTLLMAKKAGLAGRVLAFEPNPEVYDRLLSNISANAMGDRISAHRIALSERSGVGTMFGPRRDYPNRGIASLHQFVDALSEKFVVEVSTLDAQALQHGIQKLDLIKIDTEGNDVKVLLGAMATITRYRPRIVFEANRAAHRESGSSLEAVRAELRSLGYSFFTVGLAGHLRGVPPGKDLPDSNIVCLPAGP